MKKNIINFIIKFSKNEYFICNDKIILDGLDTFKDRFLYKHFKLIDKKKKVFGLIEENEKYNFLTGKKIRKFLLSKNDLERITKNMMGNTQKLISEFTSYDDFKEHLLNDLREVIIKETKIIVSKTIPKNPMPLELKLLTDIENILINQKFSKYPNEHVDSPKSLVGIVSLGDLINENHNGNKTPIKRGSFRIEGETKLKESEIAVMNKIIKMDKNK